MALGTTQTTVTYKGDGNARSFPVPFAIHEKSNLSAHAIDTLGRKLSLRPGIDYTIFATGIAGNAKYGVETAGAEIRLELATALSAGWTLYIRRQTPITQENLFHNQGPNSSRVIEESLDKLTMVCQEFSHQLEEADLPGLHEDNATLRDELSDLRESLALCTSRFSEFVPKAPSDGGLYLATGGDWIRFDSFAGDPFVKTASGYVVTQQREAYSPNRVWNIDPDFISLAPTARTGDGDSLFVIDQAGYCILRQ